MKQLPILKECVAASELMEGAAKLSPIAAFDNIIRI
jgi:hypothetical protein